MKYDTQSDGTDKINFRTGEPARKPDRAKRGGSMYQMTSPQIPNATHRYHGELCGVGCWITQFSEFK